jgi:hypothetical protein
MADGITLGRVARTSAVPFIATSFLGAALIFLVQPMFARMATPLLGGAPAVWNVSLVCFQAALLLGYAYAHLLSRLKSARLQLLIHAFVLVAGFACLPLRISDVMGEPDASNPVWWLIGTFAISIAPPFAALSATAPLVQHWYAKSGLPDAADPYHLYAASNVGSLIGLAAYPLLIEPFAPLATQSLGWMAGYAVLAFGLLYAGWTASSHAASTSESKADDAAPTWKQRLMWLLLAFVPSSLLVGATTHITTDVAAAPFLWAPPLITYLITFVIAFSKKPFIPLSLALIVSPIAAAFVALIITQVFALPLMLAFAIDLLALFAIALACHGALNARRPPAQHLTQFYLVMSLGGVLGGAFNALVAPVIFDGVFEYPLMLVAGLALLSVGQPRISRPIAIFLAASALALVIAIGFDAAQIAVHPAVKFVLLFVPVLTIILARRAPLGAAAALAIAAPIGWIMSPLAPTWSDRSFFGVVKVVDAPDIDMRMMMHGTTLHGMQAMSGDPLRLLTYYAPQTPIGQAFALYGPEARRIGVVGLGTGSSACYARAGQDWTFFEIDPLVVEVATDPKHFSFMSSCAPDARIVVGDARIRIAGDPAKFDLMLLDAFSSDTIPTHLLTREAMELYLDRLGPDGVLVFHVTNRHLELSPVVARVVAAAGAHALFQAFRPEGKLSETGVTRSDVVLISRAPAALDRARADARWSELKSDGARPWTDDYSNIIGAMLAKAGRP